MDLTRGLDDGGVLEVVSRVRTVVGHRAEGVPLHSPEFGGNEWAYVKECLDTGWVSSVGPFVNRFESDLAAYTGASYAVATSNGTAALHVCLVLAGVGTGSEVLVPSLTFVATANAVRYTGATPHFVDCEELTLGVDPDALRRHLETVAWVRGDTCTNRTTGAPIRALVVMHAFGLPARMAELKILAEEWKLTLIEDAAESIGSRIGTVHTGNFGSSAALSFNGNKIVTTGGGGAILTNDEALARRAKHLTTTARIPHRWNFVHDEVGYNYRMPNINAALGCAQLEQMPNFLKRKRAVAHHYHEVFSSLDGVSVVLERQGSTSNYWLNTLLLERADVSMRDAVLGALNDAGLTSRPVWTLMHRLPMNAEAPHAPLPVCESLASRIINVPSSANLARCD